MNIIIIGILFMIGVYLAPIVLAIILAVVGTIVNSITALFTKN